MSKIDDGIKQICEIAPVELPRRRTDERHWIITHGDDLLRLCQWARAQDYYLCTLVASDERKQEDNVFKLYYALSSPEAELVIFEYPLSDVAHPRSYPSIRGVFPSVVPLEKEMYDLFGLAPEEESADPGGFLLSAPYPAQFYPLRRSRSPAELKDRLKNTQTELNVVLAPELPEGMLVVPVGPIHAGVIEPGYFPFRVAGEIVEELPLQLGYKHRGIEKLFETEYTLESGWELAERVSGDSAFAHSLAYCQAVEALAGVTPPQGALYGRAFFLELERIYNHIADVSALAHDMAFERVSSAISILREVIVQLNRLLSGHRLLRGINRPGGITRSPLAEIEAARATIRAVVDRFLALAKETMTTPACRDRMMTTGILTRAEAKDATGLIARASGWAAHDFRLRHPEGVYQNNEVQALLRATVTPESEDYTQRQAPVFDYQLSGDVFARMAMRVAEVETSAHIIEAVGSQLIQLDPRQSLCASLTAELQAIPNLEFGMGYVEGWRGDIFYWVMKGQDNTISRCKVRDPSLFNWRVFPAAVVRKPQEGGDPKRPRYWENLLADFPLINKSFNLSYAGHDL